MADTRLTIFQSDGTTAAIDYRTEATSGDGRQVVVIGDQSINSNIAAIQQVDPTSNTQGMVVRDVNTSAIAAFLGGTLGVYLNSTAGTLNIQLKPGTIAVSLDPGHLLGSVTANAGTGTLTVAFDPGHELGMIKGTNSSLAVFLDPGHLLGSVTANAGTGSFNVQFDPGHTLGKVDAGTGTFQVYLPDTGHELGSIRGITNSINVYLGSTAGTQLVALDRDKSTLTGILGSVAVYFDRGNPSVNATFTSTSLEVVPTTGSRKTMDDAHAAQRVLIVGSQTAASLTINGTVTGITNSINVYLGATAGTIAIKIDPGYNVTGDQSTLVIPITTAGNFNGVSTLGKTIAGPTSSRVLKIFAFSLTTTAQTSLTAKLTNGAGSSPTVFYEAALQAPAQGISGTNMAVSPPGYLFATASGATLALLLDSASLVHYMVSYFEESA